MITVHRQNSTFAKYKYTDCKTEHLQQILTIYYYISWLEGSNTKHISSIEDGKSVVL